MLSLTLDVRDTLMNRLVTGGLQATPDVVVTRVAQRRIEGGNEGRWPRSFDPHTSRIASDLALMLGRNVH